MLEFRVKCKYSIESDWICSGGSNTFRDLWKEIWGDGIKFNTISTYWDEICQIETGWACTFGSPWTVIWGDGIIIINKEDWDDKSTTPNDGCSSDCKTENGYNWAPVSPDTFQLELQFVETD